MIYMQPTMTIDGLDARNFNFLLQREDYLGPWSNLTLSDMDHLLFDLRKGLERTLQAIEEAKDFEPQPYPFHNVHETHIKELGKVVDLYHNCMESLRRYRDALIGLVEHCWVIEDQHGWGNLQ